MYCLDTNIIIDYFHGDAKTVSFVDKIQEQGISITPITLMELYAGCSIHDKRQAMYTMIEDFITEVEMIDFNVEVCKRYGELYNILRSKGRMPEASDMMIAALCLKHDAILVTSNKKHFENIPGLKIECV